MQTPTTEAQDPKDKKPEYTPEHPEYPKLLYNHEKRTTAVANDKDDEGKKAKDGFVEEPYPAEDPDTLTPAEEKQLDELLGKAERVAAKRGKAPAEKPAKAAATETRTDWTKSSAPAKK